jgi:3-deoxy-7-phosphoheptulonate synthase
MTETALRTAGFAPNIVIDCSHANSLKDPYVQPLVMADCVHQIREGNQSIVGLMVESNIEGGNQPIPDDLSKLKYGCSVTDPCIDWPTTETTIRNARAVLKDILPRRAGR